MTLQTSNLRLIDRTVANIRRAFRLTAMPALKESAAPPAMPSDDPERLCRLIEECLSNRGGEVLARVRAAELGLRYLHSSPASRLEFLKVLTHRFGYDEAAVGRAMRAVEAAGDAAARQAAMRVLARTLEPSRIKLLRRFSTLPEGVKFFVDMRRDVLEMLKENPWLAELEADLKSLLAGWFDLGFLELRRITWSSSAAVLEKLIAYEAVHAIRSWADLKNRLDSDRRLYAYFHPRMPEEPLIFLEVALVNGMSTNIQELLDETAPISDPRQADTAIFYSISNAQRGLAGISFGNFLIKKVVRQLSAEFPGLKTFATLSPVPGFLRWLKQAAADGKMAAAQPGAPDPAPLREWLADEARQRDPAQLETHRVLLTALAVHYLVRERRDGRRALDPVAHFHLSNGARLERVNWQADLSAKALAQSAGLMVNYLYDVKAIEENVDAYTSRSQVAVGPSVRRLLGESRLSGAAARFRS